ncbi:hypothetical protein [Novosphingobium sp. AAP83]|uniref:hypothetical protein n=1 Tax=Novosphingobium sp. AAP83 TaxID=1523425 RepID=UPI0018D1D92A|nr:hypothetical protein [Novosphingobium sp. AAP83]
MVNVDPLKPQRQRQFHRECQQDWPGLQVLAQGIRHCQQTITQHKDIIFGVDQRHQGAGRGQNMKLRLPSLDNMLQRNQFTAEAFSHDHDTFAAQRQRETDLMAQHRSPTNWQVSTQPARISSSGLNQR